MTKKPFLLFYSLREQKYFYKKTLLYSAALGFVQMVLLLASLAKEGKAGALRRLAVPVMSSIARFARKRGEGGLFFGKAEK